MEDMLLVLVLCLILGIGYGIMAAVDRALDERRQRKAAVASIVTRKLRSAKRGLFKALEKTEKAVCYMEMCEPDTIGCEGMNIVEQF